MAEKRKNYRKNYKKYYGIDFDSNYELHHVDFDKTNNDMDNLILLPKEVHQKFHFCINELGGLKQGQLSIGMIICWKYNGDYELNTLNELCETMKEIQKWSLYKNQLEQTRVFGCRKPEFPYTSF